MKRYYFIHSLLRKKESYFFTQIMLSIKKVLKVRIISLLTLVTFLFINTAYSLANDFSNIRPPLACSKTAEEAKRLAQEEKSEFPTKLASGEGISDEQGESKEEPKPLRKCLVLDADGVLWKGIIDEDGMDGIEITPMHVRFQKAVKALKEQGVILAINSKNNPEDVGKILEEHPDMVLRTGDFSVIRANWQDKSRNIQEIADELNIGVDSLVFLDDSPRERELVGGMYPEVLIPAFSEDPERELRLLVDSGIFNQGAVTEEDRRRTELYATQRQREELRIRFAFLEDYYDSLEMKAVVWGGDMNFGYIPRIAQLTQRTNQFNLTTHRYEEEDIRAFLLNPDYKVYTLELSDKFGDAGIVGVIILHLRDYSRRIWEVDTYCLSCRAIGLTVENAFMAYVVEDLKGQIDNSAKILEGTYIPSSRNDLVKDLYGALGFTYYSSNTWHLHLEQQRLNKAPWIQVSRGQQKQLPVSERNKEIRDMFYNFLDPDDAPYLRERIIDNINKWLYLLQDNNIDITPEDVEFLIRFCQRFPAQNELLPLTRSKNLTLSRVLGTDIDVLKRKSAPDLRNVDAIERPLGEAHRIKATCDVIDEVCRSLFSDPLVLYEFEREYDTGSTDNWLERIYEYHVQYRALRKEVPTAKIPSLVVTLHDIYEYKRGSGMEDEKALEFAGVWWLQFKHQSSGFGGSSRQAIRLVHWRELLEDRDFINRVIYEDDFPDFESTYVLFVDKDVIENPSKFQRDLARLKFKNNIPIVLLTSESESSVMSVLDPEKTDLKEVQFRTLRELGFSETENFNAMKGGLASQAIPLTDNICEMYDCLRQARSKL